MLRKFWLLLVAALVIQFCPLNAEEAENNTKYPYYGEVFDLNDGYRVKVNMRAGGGINYRIMRVATEGDELIVVASRGDWLQVQLPKGSSLNAWVKAKFLDIVDKKATVNADQVSLRSDRSLKSEVLKSMKEGLELEVIKVDAGWVKVKAPKGSTCWVSAKFVRAKDKDSKLFDEEATLEKTEVAEVSGEDEAEAEEKAGTVSIKDKASEDKTVENNENKGDSPKALTSADKLKKLREKFEAQLKDKIDKESKKYDSISVFEDKYLVIGLVVNVDNNKNKKATHKLEYKDRTQYFLRSAVDEEDKKILFDLDEYSGKMVGIDGSVKLQKDGQRIVTVKKITVLDSPK